MCEVIHVCLRVDAYPMCIPTRSCTEVPECACVYMCVCVCVCVQEALSVGAGSASMIVTAGNAEERARRVLRELQARAEVVALAQVHIHTDISYFAILCSQAFLLA